MSGNFYQLYESVELREDICSRDKVDASWYVRNRRRRWPSKGGDRKVAKDMGTSRGTTRSSRGRLLAKGILRRRDDAGESGALYEVAIQLGIPHRKLPEEIAASRTLSPTAKRFFALLLDEAEECAGTWQRGPDYARRLVSWPSKVRKARRSLEAEGELVVKRTASGHPLSYTLPRERQREEARREAEREKESRRRAHRTARQRLAELAAEFPRLAHEAAETWRKAASELDPEGSAGPVDDDTTPEQMRTVLTPPQGEKGPQIGRERSALQGEKGPQIGREGSASIKPESEQIQRESADGAEFSPLASRDGAEEPSGGAGEPGALPGGGELAAARSGTVPDAADRTGEAEDEREAEPTALRWRELTRGQQAPFRELRAEGIPVAFAWETWAERWPPRNLAKVKPVVRAAWAATQEAIRHCLDYARWPGATKPRPDEWERARSWAQEPGREMIEEHLATGQPVDLAPYLARSRAAALAQRQAEPKLPDTAEGPVAGEPRPDAQRERGDGGKPAEAVKPQPKAQAEPTPTPKRAPLTTAEQAERARAQIAALTERYPKTGEGLEAGEDTGDPVGQAAGGSGAEAQTESDAKAGDADDGDPSEDPSAATTSGQGAEGQGRAKGDRL